MTLTMGHCLPTNSRQCNLRSASMLVGRGCMQALQQLHYITELHIAQQPSLTKWLVQRSIFRFTILIVKNIQQLGKLSSSEQKIVTVTTGTLWHWYCSQFHFLPQQVSMSEALPPCSRPEEREHLPFHYCRGYEKNINSVNFNMMILVSSRNKNYTKRKSITKPLNSKMRGVRRPGRVSCTVQNH